MKKIFFTILAATLAMPMWANDNDHDNEFASDEKLEAGFVTSYLNKAIEGVMSADQANTEEMTYGRNVTGFVSAPKFGGYVIGKYDYNGKDGAHKGNGFTQRLVRFYVDGTILKDFAYRIQIQTNNSSFHMKDFFVEWKKYPAFKVKVGQFKRAFGFENPMNPWDISTGDYSLMTKMLTGHNDYLGADTSGNGGRDQGVQVQGDMMPVGKDNHMLLHYQLMVSNGPGINASDNDGKKDITGTIQVQPIKGLFLGVFGWKGTFRNGTGDHTRNRYALGAKYDSNGYTLRSEYAHGQSDLGNADSWYVVGAAPINSWFRVSAQYQQYRYLKDSKNAKSQNVMSLIPEFQIHKNLKLQVQYNYNKFGNDTNSNELWVETYFRF